jgi:hypothetical protein
MNKTEKLFSLGKTRFAEHITIYDHALTIMNHGGYLKFVLLGSNYTSLVTI